MIAAGILKQAAEKFGTPVYVYCQRTIEKRAAALGRAIRWPRLRILYAMKANSNPAILKILRRYVSGIDAVSLGEARLALQTGFSPHEIMFTGSNPSPDDVIEAVEKGILVNIDSLPMLDRFGTHCVCSSQKVCVRINTSVGAGHHDHCITGGPLSKFGIWPSQVDEVLRIADHYALKIVGLHQHIGSQILEPAKFILAMKALLPVAEAFPELEFIDFGGGLGVPYRPEEKPLEVKRLGQEMSRVFRAFCKKRRKNLGLVIEPGRYLVAESGYLLVGVTAVKKNPDKRVFVGVDSGFNHLVRPAMYGSYHPIWNISNPRGAEILVDVVGNICESGDRFAKDRLVRQPRGGDLLVIGVAGAYGFSMSSNYNLRPRPAEVLVKPDGTLVLIRKRETVEQLLERGAI